MLGYAEAPELDFAVNDRQSIVLLPEKTAGSDRLVSIAFYTESDRFTVDDPDGHRLEFAPRSTARPLPLTDGISLDLRPARGLVDPLDPALALLPKPRF